MQSEAATSTRAMRRRDWVGVLAAGCLLVCSAVATAAPALTPQQLQWLQRVTYGASAENVAQLQRLGQARYSVALLQPSDDAALPAPVRAQLQQFDALHTPLDTLLVQYEADKARLQTMPEGDDKVAASKQWRARGGQMLTQARQAQLLRAVYAPDQMREQLVWF